MRLYVKCLQKVVNRPKTTFISTEHWFIGTVDMGAGLGPVDDSRVDSIISLLGKGLLCCDKELSTSLQCLKVQKFRRPRQIVKVVQNLFEGENKPEMT